MAAFRWKVVAPIPSGMMEEFYGIDILLWKSRKATMTSKRSTRSFLVAPGADRAPLLRILVYRGAGKRKEDILLLRTG
jgi:hypothetical protein